MARIIQPTDGDEDVVYEELPSENSYYTYSSPISRLIWTVLWVVNTLIGIRFLLRVFSANPAAGFTNFIYTVTDPLIRPFANVIRPTTLSGIGVWEWSSLLAIIIYWLVAFLLVRLFTLSRPVPRY